MNSFSCLENITNYNNNQFNCICQIERRFKNANDNQIFQNKRRNKNYNNHLVYINKEKASNTMKVLSEVNPNNNYRDLYKSNSKSKEEECKSSKTNINSRLNYKTKNHNYHNISTNTTYHSCDKSQKINAYNTSDNYKKLNNIKLTAQYTPRVNDKSKNFFCQKKYSDLSKTFNNFKNRDNYGYHEINEVKKKNNLIAKINNKCASEDKKVKNKNISSDLYMNNKPSLILIDNGNNTIKSKKNPSFMNGINSINDKKYNNIESNKNMNIIKFKRINIKTNQSYFNPPKNVIKEENNYSSFKSFKENHKEYIINNSKNKYKDDKENNNSNNQILIRKIYTKNTPEEKKKNDIYINGNCKNNNNNNNPLNNENDKNIINSNRFFSGDLNEFIQDPNNKKYQNKRKINNLKRQVKKIEKVYTPNKTENTQRVKHNIKESSFIRNSPDIIISKRNTKYNIDHIFKSIDKTNIKKLLQTGKIKKEDEIPHL